MPTIRLITKIKAKQNIVFDLSRSIDLHLISTEETNEKAIAGRTSGLIELGETVTWRAKHLGVYQNFTSKIIGCSKPDYFADEMLSGAFKSFKHEHIFTYNNGETILEDIMVYESPLGLLGRIVDYLFLENYMTYFLKKRNETIKQFAESENWKNILSIDNY